MPGLGLRLGRHGDHDLVADGGQEIERDLNFVFLSPGADNLSHGFVAGGHPVIPQSDIQAARGAGGVYVDQGKCPRGSPKAQGLASRQTCFYRRHPLKRWRFACLIMLRAVFTTPAFETRTVLALMTGPGEPR